MSKKLEIKNCSECPSFTGKLQRGRMKAGVDRVLINAVCTQEKGWLWSKKDEPIDFGKVTHPKCPLADCE